MISEYSVQSIIQVVPKKLLFSPGCWVSHLNPLSVF